MGAKSSKETKSLTTGKDTATLPNGTVLTERVSVGRTGREWHLPFEVKLDRTATSDRSSAVQVSWYRSEDSIVRMTCEFLRTNDPKTYHELHKHLKSHLPTHPDFPEDRRVARDAVAPLPPEASTLRAPREQTTPPSKSASFSITIPDIGPNHWAYKRHSTVGNYCSEKSGNKDEMIDLEVAQDVKAITRYLKLYQELTESVRGKNLWKATRYAAVRDPYLTCLEICVGELQTPSHFLALVHYGMGLHMMYEWNLPWDKRDFPKKVPRELASALRQSFRTLARLYREDFCS